MKNFSRPSARRVDLDKRGRYLTPTGRVCRLVGFSGRPGTVVEVTFAYEKPAEGTGPRELGERFTLTETFAQRTLVRIG